MDTSPQIPDGDQPYNMDLGGIISLLSQHLYAQGIDVVVRELLQNAVDAITERQISDAAHQGLIEIECQPQDSGGMVLTVSDNGAGISPSEITKALGTIGFSLKREGWNDDEGPFIGRFGVGLLSGFMAADEIHVVSRKCDGSSPAFRWTGRYEGKWNVNELEDDLAPGTRVFLHLEPEKAKQLPPEKVRELAQFYGEYLPGKVLFREGSAEAEVINRPPFWEESQAEDDLLRLGETTFGAHFLGAFRFECEAARASGLAFVSSRATPPGSEPRHRLYVRRMLVGDQVRGLVPESTPYLRCILNANALRVNAAREDLHGEETRRDDLRKAVGDAFDTYLKSLRKKAESRLRTIAQVHSECMVASAENNPLHLELLSRSIPLRTTLGEQTASQIVRRHGELGYVTTEKDFLRLELKAGQEGQCVARGSDMISHRLLSLMSRRSKKGEVREISASEFLDKYKDQSNQLGAAELKLLEYINRELEPDHCQGDFEEGEDPFSPATLHLDDEESIFRHLGGDTWDDDEDEAEERSPKQLILNRTHPLVERLLEAQDLPDELIQAWIRVFFQHALLAARERPTAAESRRHSKALMVIWNSGATLEL